MVIQVYAPTSKAEVEWFYEDLQDLLELRPQKDVLFIIGDWNAKLGSQETPLALGYGMKQGKCTGHSKHPLPTTQEGSAHGHHQMVYIKMKLIIFFADKDGEALYSQQKQDWELNVAQIMNSLLPNSDLN